MEAQSGRFTQGRGQATRSRLLWVGLLAAMVAAAANTLVRAISVILFDIPPDFQPLTLGLVIISSVVGALGATVAFAIVVRFARHPIRLFRMIAVVVLLLSFLNPILALPGASLQTILTLESMHVVVAAVSVGLLTTLVRSE